MVLNYFNSLECCNPSSFVGTEPYLPPELKDDGLDSTFSTQRQKLTDKVDIWQLALSLFEMMTLSTPHFKSVEAELDDMELDSTDDDYGECWDAVFSEYAGLKPGLGNNSIILRSLTILYFKGHVRLFHIGSMNR